MADTLCRVTVVGERRRVDLALPAAAPLAEYVPDLVRLCGQPVDDTFPAVWSLARVGQPPLRPEQSLADGQVVDGNVLHLRDISPDGLDDVTVQDVAEIVERASGDGADSRQRAGSLLVAGAVWLAALPVLLAATGLGRVPGGPAVAAIPPLMLALLAWAIHRRGWPVPAAATEVLAMLVVPAAAAAGWCSGTDTPTGLVGAAAGTVAGALVALAAVPGPGTTAVTGLVVPVGVAVGTAGLLEAQAAQAAAVTGLLAAWLLPAVPATAARAASFLPEPVGDGLSPEDRAVVTVRRAHLLAGVWTAGACAVLAAALVPLGIAARPASLGLVAALGAVAALTARAARRLSSVVPAHLVAALAGGTLLAGLLGSFRNGTVQEAGPLLIGGSLIATTAIALAVRRPQDAPPLAPTWIARSTSFFLVVAVPVALVELNLIEWLVGLGRQF